MENFNIIQNKLNSFIKRYYTLQLLKGSILFVSIGAFIFLVLLSVEYFLWLSSKGRLALLSLLILAEFFLLYKHIIVPILYLIKIKKGISEENAAKIIGDHFPEVNDKLYNLFDLKSNPDQSELLLASIEQRSSKLRSLDFSKAINFDSVLNQFKYLLGPVLIVALIWLSGSISSFFGSYDRVLNYNASFTPPAPFSFSLLNTDLRVYENEDYLIELQTVGKVRPDVVYIRMDGADYVMQESNGIFTYLIKAPSASIDFEFLSSEVSSQEFTLMVLKTPSIVDFELSVKYPSYIKKTNENFKNIGNLVIPEGTKVQWRLKSNNTTAINLKTIDTSYAFTRLNSNFEFKKLIRSNFEYAISTSNEHVTDFETLKYALRVVKDEFPLINVTQVLDSLQPNIRFFRGDVADDYGLKDVSIVYFETNSRDALKKVVLKNTNSSTDSFYYTYPSGLAIKDNVPYSFYFEVADNDGVNGSKITKSEVFTMAILDDNQLKDKQLETQQNLISNFDKSIDKFKNQTESLDKINNEQKQKENLSFNDKQKVSNFLEKQRLQEDQMQKFSKQLKENLQNLNKNDKLNELLQERLERQELQAEKNKKLLEELQKVADKINKEELSKRLEDVAKKQKSGQRNLEQLLELTKQYYVTEKVAQIAKDLEKLSEKQELLSKMKMLEFKEKDANKNQEKLNLDFNEIDKSLKELEIDNNQLKKPLDLDIDKNLSKEVKTDQKAALEEINKQQGQEQSSESAMAKSETNKAAKKQKAASDKMKQMAEKLQQSASSSSSSSVTEDAEVLRQILDNLLVFTFKQETLMEQLGAEQGSFVNQAKSILKQQELKTLFEHIDDSLFALSLRVPEISESINTEISEVFYNIDKANDAISESNSFTGIGYQKYVLNSGNTLSDLLVNVLDNMNQSMKSGKGEGQGQDFQLPDIIKAQSKLNDQMKKGGEGSPSPANQGEKGNEGQQGEEGDSGSEGQQGKEGQKGEGNKQGSQGQKGGVKGESGKTGEGNGGQNGQEGKGQGNGSNNGNGNQGISEAEMKEIYEIYKEQEVIKQQLEEQLNNLIENADRNLAQKLIRQMNDFQENLLENGITRNTLDKANIIQYELLKLEGAALKQGKKNERESNTNLNKFMNPITTKPKSFSDYNIEEEILNRQVLPLRQNFQNKLKEYFKAND
ncbi:MAG: hypothetical protein NWQ38_15880 [Cellulophaga sp.]|nr:hypothetical protein [Cellulophaga sp.]